MPRPSRLFLTRLVLTLHHRPSTRNDDDASPSPTSRPSTLNGDGTSPSPRPLRVTTTTAPHPRPAITHLVRPSTRGGRDASPASPLPRPPRPHPPPPSLHTARRRRRLALISPSPTFSVPPHSIVMPPRRPHPPRRDDAPSPSRSSSSSESPRPARLQTRTQTLKTRSCSHLYASRVTVQLESARTRGYTRRGYTHDTAYACQCAHAVNDTIRPPDWHARFWQAPHWRAGLACTLLSLLDFDAQFASLHPPTLRPYCCASALEVPVSLNACRSIANPPYLYTLDATELLS